MAQRGAFFLTLLLLLGLLSLASSQTASSESKQSPISDEPSKSFPTNFVPTQEQRANYWSQGGNDIVHEIWSTLRDFEPTWKDGLISSQPTGLFGATWYYAKATFRLLFMNAPSKSSETEIEAVPNISGDLANAVESLKYAAACDDSDAIFLLAEMNFYGNFSHPRNFKEAFRRYSQLAEIDGNSTAQHLVGFMYATGIGGAVERDQAKALLYQSFAAEQGHIRAEMAVAFRHHSGIGAPRDCEKATFHYKSVAEKVMEYWQSGPPGGHTLAKDAYKWADDVGGLYGEGASASSAGPNAQKEGAVYSVEDLLEFLDMRERQGDYGAVLSLGRHYYDGLRGGKRSFKRAQRQFGKIARAYWTKDGKVNPKGPKGIDKVAAKAAAYIGRMALRGEGREQNFDVARTWFIRGVANGDAFCQYHLGLIYRDGLGVKKDAYRAATYFKAAAEQDLAAAQSALGVLFLDQGDIDTASRYFDIAARHGFMEAFYYLAEMNNQGIGRERNCYLASISYKLVAERGEILHSSFAEANAAYDDNDYERALVASALAAEQGYESAQANVAYLLDDQTSVLSISRFFTMDFMSFTPSSPKSSSLLRNAQLALIYFTRSAKQLNPDSLVKMGDYYLSGATDEPDPDRASLCYSTAAENHRSAQALWNLGWMHENGVGSTQQDFHMAKRYFDLALEMNTEAYLPVKLALMKLRLRSWWNGVSGGTINPIQEDKVEPGPKTLTEWIARFIDAAAEDMEAEGGAFGSEDAEFEGVGDFGSDPLPGGDEAYFDDFDDGLVESLIIIGLAATLAFLVYYRQQRAMLQRQRDVLVRNVQAQGQQAAPAPQGQPVAAAAPGEGQQEHGQQQGQREAQAQGQELDGGFFPAPGDPDWNQWVAGGVGH